MSTNLIKPGDVEIKELFLVKDGVTLSIFPQVSAISIYEDMSAPTMLADITITDYIGLRASFPIIGEERMRITFRTPGRDVKDVATYDFAVVAINNVQIVEGGKGATYTLRCISEEHRWNAVGTIDRSYNQPIHEIVEDIVRNELYSAKPLWMDPTKGQEPLVIPLMNPLAAIDFVRRRAVSQTPTNSLYLFFENRGGFHFRTVETLNEMATRTRDPGKHFTYAPDVKRSEQADAAAYRNIINLESIEETDTITRMQSGALKNTVGGFDLHTKAYSETPFEIQNASVKTNDKGTVLPQSPTFVSKYTAKGDRKMFIPTDSSRPPNFKQDTLGARQAIAKFFNTNIVRALINGDSTLNVGDSIYLDIKKNVADTKGRKNDESASGHYIVLRLRHIISTGGRNQHLIALDCAKMGMKV
jgi:hypothetical protein